MKNNRDINIRKYIFGLIILIILYLMLEFKHRNNSNRENRNIEISENIKELNKSTKNLTDVINKDKLEIDKFFFNVKTLEKIRGLISTFPNDKELDINDNFKISLNKKGNPVKITYKRAAFELIHNNDYVNGNPTDNINVVNDVIVTENPNDINDYKLIHDLKTYLIDGYGNDAFNNFLDEVIRNTIEENKNILYEISK